MKVIMWIIHHIIRPVWSTAITVFYWLKTKRQMKKDKSLVDTHRYNKIQYEEIDSWDSLVEWLKQFKYAYDGPSGILDHDNTPLEFHTHGGDCDDFARYTKNKLRELGYKAWRVHVWCNPFEVGIAKWFQSMHYIVFLEMNGRYFVMNYSSFAEVYDLKGAIRMVAGWYKKSGYNYVNGNICWL